LVKLTKQIEWEQFTQEFGSRYAEEGRPSVPVRVMVGLHYLKHLFNESDECVVRGDKMGGEPLLAILVWL
jgi:IS5 family transposase